MAIKIVCLLPRIPEEVSGGAGDAYLVRYLSQLQVEGWDVTVIVPGNTENRALTSHHLAGIQLLQSPTTHEHLKAARVWRLLTTGFVGCPPRRYWQALSADARSALESADVIDLQFTDMIRFAATLRGQLPGATFVATAHDVMSQSVERAKTSANARVRLRARLTAWQVAPAERTGLNACHRVYVFNPLNEQLLREQGVTTDVSTTPPLVTWSAESPVPDASARRVLFIGAFWRSENDESARWFLDEVWPRVVGEAPDARARIAGAGPAEWLRSRASECVDVTGTLTDLEDAYQHVTVAVAPLVRGAGLKFKVVQALALGFPVVATSIGAEGVNEVLGFEAVTPVDDPAEFSARILAVLAEDALGAEQRQAIAHQVRDRLDVDTALAAQFRDYQHMARGDSR